MVLWFKVLWFKVLSTAALAKVGFGLERLLATSCWFRGISRPSLKFAFKKFAFRIPDFLSRVETA